MFSGLRRIRKILPVRFHIEFVYEHSLATLPAIEIPERIKIRTLASSDISLLRNVWPINLENAVRRLQRGDLCFSAFVQKDVVSYHWVQYCGDHYLQQAGRYYPVAPDEAWIYHVRVASHARGQNINSMVYSRILDDAKARGKKRVHIYTSAKNFANQKGLVKCGFRLAKKLISFRTGKKYFLIFERSV